MCVCVCVCLVRCGFVSMCVCERDTERKTEPRREEEGGLFMLLMSLPMIPPLPLSNVDDAAVCVWVRDEAPWQHLTSKARQF